VSQWIHIFIYLFLLKMSTFWFWLIFYLHGLWQICHVSKDYFSVQRLLLCCFITFAYTISVLLDTRFVSQLIWMYQLLYLEPNIIIYIVSPLELQQEFLQLGAAAICSDNPAPSVEDLADQIVEVLNYFR